MLKTFKPAIVHLIDPFSLGLVGLRHARRLALPIVASYHTHISGFIEQWGFDLLIDPTRTYLRWIHDQVDLNLRLSRATQGELEARDFKRLKVVPLSLRGGERNVRVGAAN